MAKQSSPRKPTLKRDDTRKRCSYALSLDSPVKKSELTANGTAEGDLNPLDGLDGALATGRSAETWKSDAVRSGEQTPSPRTGEHPEIDPAMMEEIRSLLETLERIEKEKAKAKRDFVLRSVIKDIKAV